MLAFFGVIRPLYKLLNRYYWKSFFGPFFCFGFPILIIGLLGLIWGDLHTTLPGVISMSIGSVGVNGLSQTIIDFKRSVLLKRIGATPVKPWMFVFTVVLYNVILSFVVTAWCFAIIAAFWPGQINDYLNGNGELIKGTFNVEWGSFIFATFYTIMLSCILGMFIVSIAKTSLGVQTVSVFATLPQFFLAGQILPLNTISASPALDGISHVVPFRYTTAMFYQSWDQSIFEGFGTDYVSYQVNLNEPQLGVQPLTIFKSYDRWLNLFMPIVYFAIFFGISAKTFRWSTR